MNIKLSDLHEMESLINNLEKYKKEIEKIDYTHEKEKFFLIMKKFRKYVLSIENENLYRTFIHSKHYKKYKKFFTNVNMYYVRTLEAIQSLSIMTRGIHNFNNFAELIDRELIKESYKTKREELGSINFSNAKSMIVVGCGPMSETLIYIYENTNIENIIGIDTNHEAVYMAGEMINGLGLNKINIFQMDGRKYNYSNADIVYIPIFVSSKDKIIDRIVETGKDSVQIIASYTKGLGNLMYEDFGKLNSRLKIDNRNDSFTSLIPQEIIKLVKYDF